jgi:hypothetical protein
MMPLKGTLEIVVYEQDTSVIVGGNRIQEGDLTITLPVRVVPAKNKRHGKKYYLNLNTYRNAHFMVLASMKREFRDMVSSMLVPLMPELADIVAAGRLRLIYTIYPFQKSDIANVASIVDKFFCDVLQEMNVIYNDDHHTIGEIIYRFGSVDRTNPRCEVKIGNMKGEYDVN